jgi:lipopolysaccharide export system permease protein
VNPRLGSSFNIVIGVLIYFTYTNLNGLMRTWIAQERISFSIGVWVTHVAILVIALYLFHRRLNLPQVSLGRLLAMMRSTLKPRSRPQPG